jgi:diaminohydroxyphosphoribosylaminopyrimidine deaminase/5-amino-6-(5-phosphoribosylamino)uracil reductase
VWVCPSLTQRVGFAEFRRRCAEAGVNGVYFEGGPHLVSQLMQEKQLDYFFSYTAPILLGDDKAKSMLGGLRTERLAQALRLADVRTELIGDDMLCRGRVVYSERMQVDETTFSLS